MLLVGCKTDPNGPLPPAANQPEPTASRFEFARIVMGSKARIVVYAENEQDATTAATSVFEEMTRQNAILSDYDPSSESMRLVTLASNEWHDASPDLVEILALSRHVWQASGGAFDPTIGPVTHLWRPAFKEAELPDSDELRHALERVGMQHLELDEEHSRVRFDREGMLLDFGGVGKGYAAQKALDVLRGHGCLSALVDMGGDLALGDPPPGKEGWRITIDNGLELPHEVALANVGVATSGDQFRHIEVDGVHYSHIIDPRTGFGLTRRVAVTVVAPEPWLADALASAASVLGEKDSQRLKDAFPKARFFIREAE